MPSPVDPAAKDCECLDTIHTGPHWVHMDRLWYARNLELLHKGGTGAIYAFAVQESERLRAKEGELTRRGLDVVPGAGTVRAATETARAAWWDLWARCQSVPREADPALHAQERAAFQEYMVLYHKADRG